MKKANKDDKKGQDGDEKKIEKEVSEEPKPPVRPEPPISPWSHPFFERGLSRSFFKEDPWFDDIFSGMDEEFARMNEMMEQRFSTIQDADSIEGPPGSPRVYGFSMRIGPDGIPHVRKWGNARPGIGFLPRSDTHDCKEEEDGMHCRTCGPSYEDGPCIDILEEEKEVRITAELPGVDKEEINLDVSEEAMTLNVDSDRKKFTRELQLPCAVRPNTAKANTKNGVLEITVKKKSGKSSSKKVNVE